MHFEQIKMDQDSFVHEDSMYFLDNTGTYLNDGFGTLVSVFLEGVSLPIHHGNIDYEEIIREIPSKNDPDKKSKVKMRAIKGLKFDSKAIKIILNRKLAELFTRVPMDTPAIVLGILLIVAVALGVINIGMWFL